MQKSGFIVTGVLLLFLAGIVPTQAATKTWTAAAGDWSVDANWGGDPYPVAGDDVVITIAGASVLLTNSTAYLGSLTLSKTLIFSNWNTTLSATTITVQANGVMTLPGAFTNNAMSNNIYIVCTNLTIDAGGKIDVDSMGFAGGTNNGGTRVSGNGPGYGYYSLSGYGNGAGHGGFAYRGPSDGQGGAPYGSPTNPTEPGSGGCSGYTGSAGNHNGGNGGGAVRIEAGAAVTLNGTITANGGAAGAVYVGGGGGSGGSILIHCRTLEGSSGVIQANGGLGFSDGGGGRIAIFYDQSAQGALGTKPIIRFTAAPPASSSVSDIGSLYFPDTYFLSETITTNLAGQLWGLTNWTATNLVVTNTWIRFPEEGFRLAVTNDVKVIGGGARMELGGSITWTRDIFTINSDTSGPALTAGGSLILTNGGSLYVYAGMTNGTAPSYGALVAVTNDVLIDANSWIYPVSHPTNGGSVRFTARTLTVAANAGFNANYKGFAGGWASQDGYGPGKGLTASGDFSSGAGYGGGGGGSHGSYVQEWLNRLGGVTYGNAQMPVDPGSGGAGSGGTHGGWAGGTIWIEASQGVIMNGTLSANGEMPPFYTCGGGAGGGVYIACQTIAGTNGTISAIGGNAPNGNDGCGGGGRIAINYNTGAQSALPVPSIIFSCAPGQLGYILGYQGADVGTLWLPDNRFLSETLPHSVQWIVPGFTSWSPNRLCISNGWIRFPFDAFVLTVTNEVTVVGTNANFNKLEVSKLTCGSIGLTNGSIVIKGYTTMPSLRCIGGIAATNSSLVLDAASTTGAAFTCGSSLALQNGSSFYLYSGMTNGAVGANGALVTVGGEFLLASNAFIYPYSHITNGGSPCFVVGSLTVARGATINANAKGYGGAINANGYGPGGGLVGAQLYTGGGGYGGRGGQGGAAYPNSYGRTYGASNAPTAPGSAGGGGYYGCFGGSGGGLVWVRAASTITLDGTITANGAKGAAQHNAGGSGGGIYLTCKTLAGTSGTLSATGGDGTLSTAEGGGGGGRIAIWRVRGDPSVFSYNVTNGIGTELPDNAAVGTIFWGRLPAPGTIISAN